MTEDMVVSLTYETVKIILVLSAPILISGLLIGLLISVFQATTQIQEPTLAFVPKLIIVFLVLMVLGSWIINSLIEYSLFVLSFIEEIMV